MNNKLLSNNKPDLLKEWNYEKNVRICNPDSVLIGSHKKVWWKCIDYKHEWKTEIRYRVNGSKCPYCSNFKILPGFNDFATRRKDLLKEWNYKRNKLDPTTVGVNNHTKVWWLCEKGHEWETTIANRNNGTSCPVCFGNKVSVGENDLKTLYPNIAKEWHPTKNGDLLPSDIKAGSNIRIWWKCSICDNEWITTPNHRTSENTGCPKCNKRSTSFSEQILYYYVKRYFNDAVLRYKTNDNVELDIFIPSKNIGIEYDGVYYHKDKTRGMSDLDKNKYCSKNKIKLYRIREKGLNKVTGSINITRNKQTYSVLEECINTLLTLLTNKPIDSVDIDNDLDSIFKDYITQAISNSLSKQYPKIAKEWHPNKNGKLRPESFLPNSNKRVWWVCRKGHDYSATISHRVTRNDGCPYCSGRKVLKGFNDLLTKNKKLSEQWNYKKNKTKPYDYTANSHKRVWWVCDKKHEWQATIKSRNEGNGCPICSNQVVKEGYNDFAHLYPELLKEWDYKKNKKINPNRIVPGTHKKVWWICGKCNNNWEAAVNKRVNGTGCLKCSRIKLKETFSKKVVCLEENITFNSLEEAANWANVTKNAISLCARGKTKTSGGYHWKYVD